MFIYYLFIYQYFEFEKIRLLKKLAVEFILFKLSNSIYATFYDC